MASLSGILRLQYLFDISEEIDLDHLRDLLRIEKPDRDANPRRQALGQLRFQRPPLEEWIPALRLASGEHFPARVRYFDYGVVGLQMELPFQSVDWTELIVLGSKWIAAAELESVAESVVKQRIRDIGPALKKPLGQILSEDYAVIELRDVLGDDQISMNAPLLLDRHGSEIAQLVRAEPGPLSALERQEVLSSCMSYAPTDLVVVGWSAALVYDKDPEGASIMAQLLEYANTQLLEFRHYDELLTKVLADVYQMVDRHPGFFRRWKMAREAEKLNAIRLDIMDLSERSDNAIKFLSDMYYARAHRLAAARIGVPDYRTLVDDKLRTAGELYRFLMDEFHHGRAFTLELMVVIILIIDLIYLFRGKTL